MTAPDFLSEASAKPRSTASSGTAWVVTWASALAMAGDEADRRREIGLARRARVAVRPDEGRFLEQQQHRIERDGAEEQAEHDDAAARPDRVAPRGAAVSALPPTVSTTRSIGSSLRELAQAALVGLRLAQHARRAERGGELGLVRDDAR